MKQTFNLLLSVLALAGFPSFACAQDSSPLRAELTKNYDKIIESIKNKKPDVSYNLETPDFVHYTSDGLKKSRLKDFDDNSKIVESFDKIESWTYRIDKIEPKDNGVTAQITQDFIIMTRPGPSSPVARVTGTAVTEDYWVKTEEGLRLKTSRDKQEQSNVPENSSPKK
jgi:hypothetical protein